MHRRNRHRSLTTKASPSTTSTIQTLTLSFDCLAHQTRYAFFSASGSRQTLFHVTAITYKSRSSLHERDEPQAANRIHQKSSLPNLTSLAHVIQPPRLSYVTT